MKIEILYPEVCGLYGDAQNGEYLKQTLPEAAHTPGPNATETSPQICTVCQIILKPVIAHEHKWSDKLSSNADGHWYACSGCAHAA